MAQAIKSPDMIKRLETNGWKVLSMSPQETEMKRGGFRARPSPDGVPLMMMSLGCSEKGSDQTCTKGCASKIMMSLVLAP